MRGRNLVRFLAVLLALCLMLSGCGGAAEPTKEMSRVGSGEEAAAVLAERAAELGYANALSELTPVSTNVSGEHTFYRLQQNYNGIPVYGQQVVYVADAEGKCLTITQNIRDIPENMDIIPTVSAEMVDGYVNTYICYELYIDKINDPVEVHLSEENLRIYYDAVWDEFHLAYQVDWGSFRFLADAHTGQVLDHFQRIQNAASPATLASNGETFQALSLSAGTYILKDMEENIYLFDAQGKTYWNCLTGNLHPNKLSLVTSPDNIFGNSNDSAEDPESAAEIFQTVRQIRKYYRDVLGDQNAHNLMVVYNDFCGWFGQNAGGGVVTAAGYEHLFPGLDTSVDGKLLGMITLGTEYSQNASSKIDILTHEYTHVLSNWIVGWSDRSDQTKMLNEAFADIMGVLIEAQIRGQSPDWQISGRNIRDPASVGLPVRTSDSVKLIDKTHDGSTVISHTAYLMWNGMDGTESKKIPTEQLIQLWYKALLMMPSNASFSNCRTVVMDAGQLMGLTSDQMACIREAFDNAQIWETSNGIRATVDCSFKINAYDQADAPLSRYEVTVEDVSDYYGTHLPDSEPIVFKATDKEPCYLTLDPGIYRITLTPHKSEESFSYLVQVQSGGADELNLFTSFLSLEKIFCRVYTCNPSYTPVPNANVMICSPETGEPVVQMNTGAAAEELVMEVPWGDYLLRIEAEGYQPYEESLRIFPLRQRQLQIELFSTQPEAPTSSTEPTAPYFDYPEVVTVQDDMDYGVYPFPKDFILEEFGYQGNDLHYVYDTDTYGYDEGGSQDTITSSSPYYWWWASFDPSVQTQINEYISLLSQEPFCLELIYTKDMGQEWVYVYRYTGKHEVYPLNISGFVPADAGEYHFAVDISKRADYHGRISLEIAAGYGLEPITPEILEDIHREIGYNRTSNATENVEEQESLDSGKCYFCYKTVYATAERPIYNEQIVYCDTCYAEMFGG